jgi:hypothetical protein
MSLPPSAKNILAAFDVLRDPSVFPWCDRWFSDQAWTDYIISTYPVMSELGVLRFNLVLGRSCYGTIILGKEQEWNTLGIYAFCMRVGERPRVKFFYVSKKNIEPPPFPTAGSFWLERWKKKIGSGKVEVPQRPRPTEINTQVPNCSEQETGIVTPDEATNQNASSPSRAPAFLFGNSETGEAQRAGGTAALSFPRPTSRPILQEQQNASNLGPQFTAFPDREERRAPADNSTIMSPELNLKRRTGRIRTKNDRSPADAPKTPYEKFSRLQQFPHQSTTAANVRIAGSPVAKRGIFVTNANAEPTQVEPSSAIIQMPLVEVIDASKAQLIEARIFTVPEGKKVFRLSKKDGQTIYALVPNGFDAVLHVVKPRNTTQEIECVICVPSTMLLVQRAQVQRFAKHRDTATKLNNFLS